MKNYVNCNSCAWRLENFPNHNWNEYPCSKCKNTRQVIDPKDILCNLCGESMCPIGSMNEQDPHGLHEANVTGGYDSYHLTDMNTYTFSFCEKCLRQLFMQCKIKPKVSYSVYNKIEEYDFEKDQQEYEYRLWIDNGGYHQAYLNRKCNFKKDCPNDAVYTELCRGEFTESSYCEEHKFLRKYLVNYELVKFIPNNLKSFL